MTSVLVTGGAGFIGFHLIQKLVNDGYKVHALDNFNDYYDVELKIHREVMLKQLNVHVQNIDLNSKNELGNYINGIIPDVVIHLAAYAGVRHSYDNAMKYIQNNIVGTQNLIDVCEKNHIQKVIYASTSCVMAGNPLPWKEDVPLNLQLNPYGYTKRANECQFATSKIKQTIGLRFFTVYGPWGRPDMALFSFSKAAVEGKPIDVFNYGDMKRDFTYVDDIVAGIGILLNRIREKPIDFSEDEIYNIGYGEQINLMDFISEIEKNFGRTIEKNLVPKHPADTQETWSDTTKLQALGWKPTTSIKDGVAKFADWYKNYYGCN
jgi:UDP-glucuronate 4-epimerase